MFATDAACDWAMSISARCKALGRGHQVNYFVTSVSIKVVNANFGVSLPENNSPEIVIFEFFFEPANHTKYLRIRGPQ